MPSDLIKIISTSKEELDKKISDDIEDWLWNSLNTIYKAEKIKLLWIGILDNTELIEPLIAVGMNDYKSNMEIDYNNKSNDKNPIKYAIESGEIQIDERIKKEKYMQPWQTTALKSGFKSIAVFPIKNSKNETFGVLNIYSDKKNYFNERKIYYLDLFVKKIASLIFKVYKTNN